MKIIKAKKIFSSILAFSLLLVLSACVKEIDNYATPANVAPVNDIKELIVPSSFNYEMDKKVTVSIKILGNDNSPLKGIKLRLMDNSPENNGQIFYSGITDQNGDLNAIVKLPFELTKVVVNSNYIGIVNNAIVDVSNKYGSIIIGGSTPKNYSVVEAIHKSNLFTNNTLRTSAVPNKNYLGSWNSNGVPNYLDNHRDVINAGFLSRINNSLPESQPVPTYHPDYIASTAQSTISLTQKADLWMTFVHEGAGYKNTIGYYAYNKNNPPTSLSDISKINIVFPNFSYQNSGGGLISGDKVYLGSFGTDTIIGFVLLSNAYNSSNSTVGNGYYQYYSDDEFNPESSSSLKAHNVVLWDSTEQKLVIGFEDLNRGSWCDNDFNDAIFYISSNPGNAIGSNNANVTALESDNDNDGVGNSSDDYPNDGSLATNSFYPSNNLFGHLAFEDLWPTRGDFDFNDLIVGYKYNTIKNSNNMVAEVDAEIFVNAVGGSYQNGFGFELPIPSSFVQSVTGNNLSGNYIHQNGNNTEAGQQNCVVIAFDNALNLAKRPSGYYVNTQIGSPVVISDTLHIKIKFVTPLSTNSIGLSPFNPFMISNLRRGYEIHLPDNAPTDLADMSLFNTFSDRSNVALGRYYKSDQNLPWALNVPAAYPIVVEKNQIIAAYTKFQYWAVSGGTQYQDWYQDKPGYRNTNYILNR